MWGLWNGETELQFHINETINLLDLGSVFNAYNNINIEIAERIAESNKAYYANTKLIKPKFLKKNTNENI